MILAPTKTISHSSCCAGSTGLGSGSGIEHHWVGAWWFWHLQASSRRWRYLHPARYCRHWAGMPAKHLLANLVLKTVRNCLCFKLSHLSEVAHDALGTLGPDYPDSPDPKIWELENPQYLIFKLSITWSSNLTYSDAPAASKNEAGTGRRQFA